MFLIHSAYIDGLSVASYCCPVHGSEPLLSSEVDVGPACQQWHYTLGVAVTPTGQAQGRV